MNANRNGFKYKKPSDGERRFEHQTNVGNRKTFEELKIPPDDVGNTLDEDNFSSFVHDGLGNCIDGAPSHMKSGILSTLVTERGRFLTKRRIKNRDVGYINSVPGDALNSSITRIKSPKPVPMDKGECNPTSKNGQHKPIEPNPESLMRHLCEEFTRLLKNRSGLPFSFAMRPFIDDAIDEGKEQKYLGSIELLISTLFSKAKMDASVVLSQYRTTKHRFAVFFINPLEKDPIKNKDLISALRQVIKAYSIINPQSQENVMVVLANARSIIEEHLQKIGALRV